MATKNDQERLGLFSETSYITVGDKYTGPKPFGVTTKASLKGKRQMLTPATKPKCAGSDGYFSQKFERIYEGEAVTDSVRRRRKRQAKEKAKFLGGPIKPSGSTKPLACPGSYDGTFSGKIEAMSFKDRPRKSYESPKRNFTTFPAKKGTGYGYNNVTIGKTPEYKPSPYKSEELQEKKLHRESKKKIVAGPFKLNGPNTGDVFTKNPYEGGSAQTRKLPPVKKVTVPFVPNKPALGMKSGGKEFGTFSKFEYTGDGKKKVGKPKAKPKFGAFKPTNNPKSMVTKSIISTNVNRSINSHNYRTVKI
eukprot:m.139907 g.139907  ORF g.139907 m.139907 type:complete len:306 (-) comp17646_c0_seq1:118-1035(-)